MLNSTATTKQDLFEQPFRYTPAPAQGTAASVEHLPADAATAVTGQVEHLVSPPGPGRRTTGSGDSEAAARYMAVGFSAGSLQEVAAGFIRTSASPVGGLASSRRFC